FLRTDNPQFSVIAAFALAQSPRDQDRSDLVKAYDTLKDRDVLWAIAEALGGLDVQWLHREVIQPWIAVCQANPDANAMRAEHVSYLVQKTSIAAQPVREQLRVWLRDGSPMLQGRAVRAFSKLGDRRVEAWLRPLCENIAAGRLASIDPA